MSQLLSAGFEEIENPFVVVCEGSGDARFVFELLKTREVANCSVGYPNEKDAKGGGKDAIEAYLVAISTWFAIHPDKNLQGLMLLLDADDKPESAFRLACKAFKGAGFHIPSKAYSCESSIKSKDEFPANVAVYLIPGMMQSGEQETGTLEDILLRAAFAKNPLYEGCLDAFLGCIGKAPEHQPNKRAKMRMSALVGASFPSNPWASVDKLLASSKNDLVPMNSQHFSDLADFLAKFCRE
jgi:hypothetical protein